MRNSLMTDFSTEFILGKNKIPPLPLDPVDKVKRFFDDVSKNPAVA